MCGILGGLVARPPAAVTLFAARVQEIADAALHHRGPDAAGQWCDSAAGAVLGHRRLAILDLSTAANQPFASGDGSVRVVFNGEIYDHADHRRALQATGVPFRTRSDTEVLAELLARYGTPRTVERIHGAFAFAAFDRRSGTLTLARDRLGEKPLFVAVAPDAVAFASEEHALAALIGAAPQADPGAIARYLAFGHVGPTLSALAGMEQVPPGGWWSVSRTGDRVRCQRRRYWSVEEAAAWVQAAAPRDLAAKDDSLRAAIATSVREQAVADVPVVVLASGGVDSTLVALAAHTPSVVGALHASFAGEPPLTRAFRAHLEATVGCPVEEVTIDPRELLHEWTRQQAASPLLLADPARAAVGLLAAAARTKATVALTGDGGDEAFNGYRRSVVADRMGRWSRPVVTLAWRVAAALLGAPTARWWGAVPRDTWHAKARTVVQHPDLPIHVALSLDWPGAVEVPSTDPRLFELAHTLPGQMHPKSDRAGMVHSIEFRAPLADSRVVEAALAYTSAELRSGWVGKLPLRRLVRAAGVSPRATAGKRGFDVPVERWVFGALREPVEEALASGTLASLGIPPHFIASAQTALRRQERWAARRIWNLFVAHDWWHAVSAAVARAGSLQ